MAVVEKINDKQQDEKRQVSTTKFPYYALADSVAVAQTIYQKAGGSATLDELAAHLNYAGTDNGAFKSRIAAARTFGLVERSNDKLVLSQIAQSILTPVYDWMPKEGLAKAFLNVELFKKVYEEYKGKQLPPDFGLKNALKTTFGIAPPSVERAFRVLIESAETAGFFETRAGARTHLIIPTINKGGAVIAEPAAATPATGGGSGGNGADGELPAQNEQPAEIRKAMAAGQPSLENVKARYVQTLINMLEEKGKKGELDTDLMARIEKLLNV